MKSSQLLFILCAFISFNTCKDSDPNKHIDEGIIKEGTYHSKEIGWTINLPEGWEVIDSRKQAALQKRGMDAIGSANDITVDVSGLKNLITFKKDIFNSFLSTSESIEFENEAAWSDNIETVKNYLIATYQNEGIDHDASDTVTEMIDGLEFKTYTFRLYDPKNGKIILNQLVYARYINGFDFGVCINYNNEDDKAVMLEAFKNSKFRRGKS
jgi:hypothetical protein